LPETDLTHTLEEDLELIRVAAEEAGRIAMGFFGRDPEVWMKAGVSPVSEADYAVDAFLKGSLRAARPDYGWLSEETADTPDRLAADRTFVVDPIDGTRAFLERKDVWCVSIAVVEAGRPLAGVLDCPARKEVYVASPGKGATLNGERISVREPGRDPVVAGPKPLVRALPDRWRPANSHPYIPSLAYRIARLARGSLDGTFVKANSHDWDLAAADLILSEAGGTIVDEAGRTLRYAGAEPSHGILAAAGSRALLDQMVRTIAEFRE
jgi:myo-inositol-1(or 4)-monophosphatase